MRLLLDSHAFLWFCEGSSSLSGPARKAIESPDNEKLVSHATAWEVAIKVSIGKLSLLVPYADLFPGAVMANGFIVLPTEFKHFETLMKLPRHHGDPFDRLIIAQAQAEGLTVMSCDPEFKRYGVPLLW
jgi:PIN domain nuclease of toxin-antitoxin system